jgi:hypothetical protein
MHRITTFSQLITCVVFCICSFTTQAQSNSKPEGFWASREANVMANDNLSMVRIAIWDSGVDTPLFESRVVRDAKGAFLLRDYDAFKNRQDTALAVISDDVLRRQYELNEMLRALDDLDGGVDSLAAKALNERLNSSTPDETAEFEAIIGLWSGYVHGTGVADIAIKDNPFTEIIIARMEWWHGSPPIPCWTYALAIREADSIGDQLKFLVGNGARIVNMSWGRAEQAYLSNLQECAPQMPEQDRIKLARYIVEAIRNVLIEGMTLAPNVLFVGAADNAGSNIQTANPATLFTLPNFLLVGAVDQQGEAIDWSNAGPEVTLYANGERVPALMPGGDISYPSGTSMATPFVVNAAAKALAVFPSMSGAELKLLLERTATSNPTGQPVLHPMRAFEAARKLKSNYIAL